MKYAVIVDAGSSGSRVYVYTWPDAVGYLEGQKPGSILSQSLLPVSTMDPWKLKIQPGISSFRGSTDRIWKDHLKLLMKKAMEIVPSSQHSETPVYFLATAGMRLLSESDRSAILSEVCRLLQKRTNFLVPECGSHVAMIDGQTEGLYGWLGLNYLVHMQLSRRWNDFDSTYGFLDMGGASAQLAFASTADSEHKNDLHSLQIRTASGDPVQWWVFVTTWLGYGTNQARNRLHKQIAEDISDEGRREYVDNGVPIPAIDPCMPTGALETVNLSDNHQYVFQGSGDWKLCESRVAELLNRGVPCEDDPCLFDGTHVPDFDLEGKRFVGVSEYWYTVQDMFAAQGKFEYADLEPKISELCSSDWTSIQHRLAHDELLPGGETQVTEEGIKQACFKSAWVLTVLSKGFNFPLSNENSASAHNFQDTFQSASDIQGTEISWTLGRAVLYASSQIPPSSGNEGKDVGYTMLDGSFVKGGELLTPQQISDFKGTRRSSRWPLVLLLVIIIGILFVLSGKWARLSRSKFVKRMKRRVRQWFPTSEQTLQQYTASSIGYGYSYPHAGIPLATLDPLSRDSEGISTTRTPDRAPSRVGSRVSLSSVDAQRFSAA